MVRPVAEQAVRPVEGDGAATREVEQSEQMEKREIWLKRHEPPARHRTCFFNGLPDVARGPDSNRCDLRICGFNTDHHKRLIIPRPYPRLMFSYCGGKVIDHALRLTGAVCERSLDAVDVKHLTGR